MVEHQLLEAAAELRYGIKAQDVGWEVFRACALRLWSLRLECWGPVASGVGRDEFDEQDHHPPYQLQAELKRRGNIKALKMDIGVYMGVHIDATHYMSIGSTRKDGSSIRIWSPGKGEK